MHSRKLKIESNETEIKYIQHSVLPPFLLGETNFSKICCLWGMIIFALKGEGGGKLNYGGNICLGGGGGR